MNYFGRFFGESGASTPPPTPGQIWGHVLSNGKSAAQNVVEINAGIAALLAAPNCLETEIQGTFTAADVLRILAAVAAGGTSITPLGGGAATVEFEAIDGSGTIVSADMQGSERLDVTLTP